MSRLLALLAVLIVLVPSLAWSYPYCNLWLPDVSIPANGAVPLPTTASQGECDLDVVRVTVRDSEQSSVEGELRRLSAGNYWFPAEPLQVGLRYEALVEDSQGFQDSMWIDVLEPYTETPSVSIKQASLFDNYHTIQDCCDANCEANPDLCTYSTQFCWDNAFSPELERGLVLELEKTGHESLHSYRLRVTHGDQVLFEDDYNFSYAPGTIFLPSEPGLPICASLTLEALADGQVLDQTEESCVQSSTPFEDTLELVDFSVCQRPGDYAEHPLNLTPGAGLAKSEDSGCSLRQTKASQVPVWLSVGLLAALLFLRRRRD
ncbi:MAG: hypothetical protein RBU37_14445 [Myxococcota bacterium]|jgi:hypothetical protein|nr:hypothetical protein [Myxococcota bacterium]